MNPCFHAIRFPPPSRILAAGAVVLCALSGLSSGAPIPHSLELSFFSSSPAAQDETAMGTAVALAGGFAVVGSPLDDLGGEDSGVVRVYNTSTGALLHLLPNPTPRQQDKFGSAVAVAGQRVVVGAPSDDTAAQGAGTVYIFDLLSPTPAVPVMTLGNPSPGTDDMFGAAVAISGSIVAVGVPEDDGGAVDAGSVFVYNLASGNPTIPITLVDPSPSVDEQFGWSVAVSGNRVAVGILLDDTGATDTGRVRIFDVSSVPPQTPLATLNNPSPAINDQFGGAVAIAGNLVAVGAPADDTDGENSGNTYLFDLGSGNPGAPVSILTNPGPSANESYGFSVAISGSKVIVGAHGDDTGALDSGAAYVFNVAAPSAPLVQLSVANPTPAPADGFGRTVAIDGNIYLVGSPSDNTISPDAGSAYLYNLPSNTPAYALADPSPLSDEEFATSVAISGTRVVIGAPKDDKGAINAGSVYVYNTALNPGVPAAILENPSPTLNDSFGAWVAVSGNWVAVAAPTDDLPGASNAGSVYIYNFSSGIPSAPAITIPNPQPGPQDKFGTALAMSGTRLIVGAFQNDSGALRSGSAYVFELASGTPAVPIAILDNPNPAIDDWFGHSVAISGDRMIVGAHLNDISVANTGITYVNAGSAYVYDMSSGSAVLVLTLDNPELSADDWFGYGVGISGSRIIVGASRDDAGDIDTGRAYVYDLNSATPASPVHVLSNPAPEEEEYFGLAVALAGTRAVVGVPQDTTAGNDSGTAYVYEFTSATPSLPVAELVHPGQTDDEWLGFSTAIDGTNILIGAPLQNGNTHNRGAAFFFDPDPPVPILLVEYPEGIVLGGEDVSVNFGVFPLGSVWAPQTLLVRNVGTAPLELTDLVIGGGSASDFNVVSPSLPAILQVDATMSINVEFGPNGSGSRLSTLDIVSSDPVNSPLQIGLTAQVLSSQDDTDGDGLNDVAELQMEDFGFDWQVNDEELVAIYFSGVGTAGFFTRPQLVEQSPGSLLVEPEAVGGEFKVTIGVEKSTGLSLFERLPMQESQTTVNGQGRFEFQFTSPQDAAFFRLVPR